MLHTAFIQAEDFTLTLEENKSERKAFHVHDLLLQFKSHSGEYIHC